MSGFLFAVAVFMVIGIYGMRSTNKRRKAELMRAHRAYMDFWPTWDSWILHFPDSTVSTFASEFVRDRGIAGVNEFHMWVQASPEYRRVPEPQR